MGVESELSVIIRIMIVYTDVNMLFGYTVAQSKIALHTVYKGLQENLSPHRSLE